MFAFSGFFGQQVDQGDHVTMDDVRQTCREGLEECNRVDAMLQELKGEDGERVDSSFRRWNQQNPIFSQEKAFGRAGV